MCLSYKKNNRFKNIFFKEEINTIIKECKIVLKLNTLIPTII